MLLRTYFVENVEWIVLQGRNALASYQRGRQIWRTGHSFKDVENAERKL